MAINDEGKGTCDICGERIDTSPPLSSLSDIGEFWSTNIDDSIIAHAECGINAGYELA